jgi:putative intracellular protease/amidase
MKYEHGNVDERLRFPMNTPTTRKVHLYVFDAMEDWEAALAVAAINSPQFQSGRYRMVTVASSLRPITTMGGVLIQPDVSIDAVTPDSSAMLVLPGGQSWERDAHGEALQLASRFIAAGTPVAAICAATLALARAGFLDRLRQSGDAREYLISSGHHGTAFYCGMPSIGGNGTISASAVAPVDFAREIFRMLSLSSRGPGEARYAMFKHGDAAKSYVLSTRCAMN